MSLYSTELKLERALFIRKHQNLPHLNVSSVLKSLNLEHLAKKSSINEYAQMNRQVKGTHII